MKKMKYFLFTLLCMICSSVVFAENEIIVESMTPIYDENSGVKVTVEDGVHNVIFTDKNQNVKYDIVLKNTTNDDIFIESIVLPDTGVEFLKYKLSGFGTDKMLNSNSTENLILSLEIVETKGWGRNFEFNLTDKVYIDPSIVNPDVENVYDNPVIVNPNTDVKEIIVVLICFLIITVCLVIFVRNKKITRYVVSVLLVGIMIPVTRAEFTFELPIKLNVSFESQNIMKPSYVLNGEYKTMIDYWSYGHSIKNIYVQNEFNEIIDYIYKFDVSDKGNGKVLAYLVANPEAEYYYDLYLQADGIIYANPDSSNYFADMYYLEKIDNVEGFDTSDVTNMSYMFSRTGYSNRNFVLDLSGFDTSNVTDMSYMFNQTGAYSANFVLDLGDNFDSSNVTDMSYMFNEIALNTSEFYLDLSSLDTENVIDMSYMFNASGYYSPNFSVNLSNFDTSNVINMMYMFYQTGYSSPNFNLDVSNFDTSKVTNMYAMFCHTGFKSNMFNLDVSNFDTSNVTDMGYMFAYTGYNSPDFSLNLSNFDTSKVTNMAYMFSNTAYNSLGFTLDVSNFDTSNVTDMSEMFANLGVYSTKLELDLSSFDTKNVTKMYKMFYQVGYNSPIFTLDVSNFNTSNVTDMSYMFAYTGYATENFVLDLTSFNTSKVTTMYRMFCQAGYNSKIFDLDISSFDTSNVTDMGYMFYEVSRNNPDFNLDISKIDTSSVTNMNMMFYGAGKQSTKFVSTFTIRNPEVETYYMAFARTAENDGCLIKINYINGAETVARELVNTSFNEETVLLGVEVE